jgi:hypothetical protein
VRAKQTLGPLAAPLDLQPKRLPFRFEAIGNNLEGWRVVVDPDNQVPEIYEGNNTAPWRRPGALAKPANL